MQRLVHFIQNNHIETPVKLEIELIKLANRYSGTGNQSRYFRVSIGGKDLTQTIANIAGLKLSKARDTNGCLIIHGSGMDMGFALQDKIRRRACQEGYPDLFADDYIYVDENDRRAAENEILEGFKEPEQDTCLELA